VTVASVVIDIANPSATEPDLVGAKAASLARSLQAGVAVLPGFVLTTVGAERGADDSSVVAGLERAWGALRREHDGPVVVRSSSTVEDAAESSMAGQFTSVLDVHDWPQLCDAVARVLDSAQRVAGPHAPQPMAVLVQPQLAPIVGGVMFGVDPVSGNRHRVVVDAVPARVDDLVSGRVTAAHYVLSRRGRVLEVVHADVATRLRRSQRHRLVRLARAAQQVFGAPQDVEWAIDADDRLWLLQSRPVTAVTAVPAVPSRILLGPGPVAETFPRPLRVLETELWIEPLRAGITRALLTTRAVSRRRLASSPVLTTVGGYAAVDLELLGVTHAHRVLLRRLDPRPGTRRLLAAWRVGRLRIALPTITAGLIDTVDDDLASVGTLARLADTELLQLLEVARRELTTVHAVEILTGMLATSDANEPSLPLVAMRAVAAGRATGLDDADIVARNPEVLALIPPSLAGTAPLPAVHEVTDGDADAGIVALGDRDALRLRTRWLQELLARIARELAHRLVVRAVLRDAIAVRDCTIDELSRLVQDGTAPADLVERSAIPPGPPLPAMFRLAASGDVVPRAIEGNADGVPAGGGRGVGTVTDSIRGAPDAIGSVLVVTNLEPRLAAVLPDLAGLVAETGSALSHLAILAREMHVPTVVAVRDARQRFPPGTRVLVDGTTGEVSAVADEVTT
jgi:pyruvate,water dikinase